MQPGCHWKPFAQTRGLCPSNRSYRFDGYLVAIHSLWADCRSTGYHFPTRARSQGPEADDRKRADHGSLPSPDIISLGMSANHPQANFTSRPVGGSMLWVEFPSGAAPRAWRMTRQSDTPTTRPMHTSYIAADHYCQNSNGPQPKASEKRPRQKTCPQKRGDAACVPDSHAHDDIMPSDKRSPSKRPVHFCEDD